MNKYYIATYATSPSPDKWNSHLEKSYFSTLSNNKEIIGIEHPVYLNEERYPIAWLNENIPDNWQIIITALPLFMNELKNNPLIGLASSDEKDRYAAIKIMEKIAKYIEKINVSFARKIVTKLHFHSLPRNNKEILAGNKLALKKSLQDMQNINWNNIELNLEHCDAYINNQEVDKGFLLLEDELEALDHIKGYGIMLNWGRSAIETKSAKGVISHINQAKNSNLLKGFFFSGCTNNPQSSYGYWKDTHMPPKNFINGNYLQNDSMLGKEEIRDTLKELNERIYLGIKVSNRFEESNIKTSVELNLETIKAINNT